MFEAESDSKIQGFVESSLGISSKMFLSSVLTAQKETSNFLTSTDKEKKQIISQLLDLTVYEKAHDKVKKDLSDLQKKRLPVEKELELLEDKKIKLMDDLKNVTNSVDNYENEKKQKLQNLNLKKEKYEAIKKDLDRLEGKEDPLPAFLKKKEELEEKKKKIELALEKVSEKKRERDLTLRDVDSLKREYKERLAEKEELESKVKNLESNLKGFTGKQDIDLKIKEISNELDDLIKEKEEKESLLASVSSKEEGIKNKISQQEFDLNSKKKNESSFKVGEDCPTCNREFLPQDIEHIEKEKEANDKKIEQIKGLINKLNEDLKEVREEKNKIEDEILKIKELVKNKEDNIKEINSKEYLIEDLKASKDKLEKYLSSIESVKKKLESKEEELDKTDKIEETYNEYKKKEKKIKEYIQVKFDSKLVSVQQESIKINNLEENKKENEERLLEVNKDLENLDNNENPHLKYLKQTNERVKESKNDLNRVKLKIEKIDEEIKYLTFWKQGFSPSGILSFITEDIIEHLNMVVQENLEILCEGSINITFEAEKENAKGVVKNEIETHYYNEGEPTSWELLSGGEQQRCILAVTLALTEVAEMRAGTTFNVRFLDEPFDGIDSAGQLEAFKLFSKLSKNKDGFFIVSHDESFQNLCSYAVYVVKQKGESRIVSKEEFDKIKNGENESSNEDSNFMDLFGN